MFLLFLCIKINFMDFLLNLIIGVASGVAASYFFLKFFLSKKKPIIAISDHISKQIVNNENSYLIKFVNMTDSEIFDIHIELTFYKPIGDYNGGNLQGKDIHHPEVSFPAEADITFHPYDKILFPLLFLHRLRSQNRKDMLEDRFFCSFELPSTKEVRFSQGLLHKVQDNIPDL